MALVFQSIRPDAGAIKLNTATEAKRNGVSINMKLNMPIPSIRPNALKIFQMGGAEGKSDEQIAGNLGNPKTLARALKADIKRNGVSINMKLNMPIPSIRPNALKNERHVFCSSASL
jgi:hypothetical protein